MDIEAVRFQISSQDKMTCIVLDRGEYNTDGRGLLARQAHRLSQGREAVGETRRSAARGARVAKAAVLYGWGLSTRRRDRGANEVLA